MSRDHSAIARKAARTRARMRLVRGDAPRCARCADEPAAGDCYCRACRAEYMFIFKWVRKVSREKAVKNMNAAEVA